MIEGLYSSYVCLVFASKAGESGKRKKQNNVEGTLSIILTMFLCLSTIQIVSD